MPGHGGGGSHGSSGGHGGSFGGHGGHGGSIGHGGFRGGYRGGSWGSSVAPYPYPWGTGAQYRRGAHFHSWPYILSNGGIDTSFGPLFGWDWASPYILDPNWMNGDLVLQAQDQAAQNAQAQVGLKNYVDHHVRKLQIIALIVAAIAIILLIQSKRS